MERVPLPDAASQEAEAFHGELESAFDTLDSKANAPADEKAAAERAVRVAARAFFERLLIDSSTAFTTALATTRQTVREGLLDLGFTDPPNAWIENHPNIRAATETLNATQSALSEQASAFN